MALIDNLKALFTSDTLDRAFKTFLQAFFAQYLALADANRQTIVVSAAAAGLSAVWNAVVSPILEKAKSARAAKKA